MDLREKGRESVELIHLVWERDEWQALVNMVMDIQVP
jgi:hypothetical protein